MGKQNLISLSALFLVLTASVAAAGTITQIIDATGDGMGNTLDGASGIAVDGAGNAYVVDSPTDSAFKITPNGTITQIIDADGDGMGGRQGERQRLQDHAERDDQRDHRLHRRQHGQYALLRARCRSGELLGQRLRSQPPGIFATRSISTRAPAGRPATWTVERAGRWSPMASL